MEKRLAYSGPAYRRVTAAPCYCAYCGSHFPPRQSWDSAIDEDLQVLICRQCGCLTPWVKGPWEPIAPSSP